MAKTDTLQEHHEIRESLKRVSREYTQAQAEADAVNARRISIIRHAVAEGIPQAEVARIVGVGKARVGQIVKGGAA